MTFWITVAVPTAMKDYIRKLSIMSYVTKHRASGTSLLITQPEYYYLLLIQELS